MGFKNGAKFKGKFEFVVRDKSGNLISKTECHNIITDEGLNHILNVVLHDTAKIVTWYCGLFESDTTMDGSETYDVPVFTESTSYDEATRPEFNNAASAAKSTTNSANPAVFTVSDSKTFYGAFITSVNTKGDHAAGATNVLFCGGKFTTAQPAIDGNVCSLVYTNTSADIGV